MSEKLCLSEVSSDVSEEQILCDIVALLTVSKVLSGSLKDILDNTNQALEKATDEVVDQVLLIARQAKELNSIVDEALEGEGTKDQRERASDSRTKIDVAVKSITTHLQFQDRNTQMLGDKMALFEHYIECVDALDKDYTHARKTDKHGEKIQKHAWNLFGISRMSDIKDILMRAFVNQNLTVDGVKEESKKEDTDDNVQLF